MPEAWDALIGAINTTLRFACMVLIALYVCSLSEALSQHKHCYFSPISLRLNIFELRLYFISRACFADRKSINHSEYLSAPKHLQEIQHVDEFHLA